MAFGDGHVDWVTRKEFDEVMKYAAEAKARMIELVAVLAIGGIFLAHLAHEPATPLETLARAFPGAVMARMSVRTTWCTPGARTSSPRRP